MALSGGRGSQPMPPSTTTVPQTEDTVTDIGINIKEVSAPQCPDDGATAAAFVMEAGTSTQPSSVSQAEDADICIKKKVSAPQCPDDGATAAAFRKAGTSTQPSSEWDFPTYVGKGTSSADDEQEDLPIVEADREEPSKKKKKKGPITQTSDNDDLLQLLCDTPRTYTGIIIESQEVLHCQDGYYAEGLQYKIFPDTQLEEGFGVAIMCVDLTTRKRFRRKTVKGALSRNEVAVPLKFQNIVGIPQVFGVIITKHFTRIFQEFAGMSLDVMKLKSDYAVELRLPHTVMVLAYQGFVTIWELHCQAVTHCNIKPENIRVEKLPNGDWCLKLADFGFSRMPGDKGIKGLIKELTYEYLSPESCCALLQVTSKNLQPGRLGQGNDVWALALSLLYCLLDYHGMVYLLTERTMYYQETDPAKLQCLGWECLEKICTLSDKDMSKLICAEWPEALKTLLVNTLRVDPAKRWSAKTAAQFIKENWILKGFSGQSQASGPSVNVGRDHVPGIGCPQASASATDRCRPPLHSLSRERMRDKLCSAPPPPPTRPLPPPPTPPPLWPPPPPPSCQTACCPTTAAAAASLPDEAPGPTRVRKPQEQRHNTSLKRRNPLPQ